MSKLPDIETFTAIADKYGDSIDSTQKAEEFFDDFMKVTDGAVIVDYLDCDNDDRIEKVVFDHNNSLMTLYTRIPEADPEERMMRKMVLPFDSYGILVRFKNIRFVRVKDNKCLAIVVNGYTMHRNMIKAHADSIGSSILKMDEKGSFFTTNVVVNKDSKYEYLRAMTTPLTSFWIIPKGLMIHPQDSEQYLYLYNTEALYSKASRIWRKLGALLKSANDIEEKDDFIKMYGNQLRCVAEGLFKLIMCFYFDKFDFKNRDTAYNLRRLGGVIGSLKDNVYTSHSDLEKMNKIAKTSNELSHDSGLPVSLDALDEMYNILKDYMLDFKKKIETHDNIPEPALPSKPSPKDFIEKNLMNWDFSKEIESIDNTKTTNCSFRLKINKPCHFCDIFATEDNYLCKDGKIRTLKYDDPSDALMISNRDAIFKLEEAIHNSIAEKCDAHGLDTDRHLVHLNPEIIKGGTPEHLFTLDEIKTLMRNADDRRDNKLVIDENGYAHIIQDRRQWNLYPVSIETWCAGNGYVGAESSLNDAEPGYHLCLKLWLSYLRTGMRQYDDFYESIDEEDMISKIKKYYT